VLNYRKYPKNKTGYPFLDQPVQYEPRRTANATHITLKNQKLVVRKR